MDKFQYLSTFGEVFAIIMAAWVLEVGIKMYCIVHLEGYEPKVMWWSVFGIGLIGHFILIKMNLGYIHFSILGVSAVLLWSGFIKYFTIIFFGESNKLLFNNTLFYIVLLILFIYIFGPK